MGSYINITFEGGEPKHRCVICGFPLDDVFPNDFPEEFKFCCGCLIFAKTLTKFDINSFIFNPRLIKIYNTISLI